MESAIIENKTFEKMAAKFDYFVSREGNICRKNCDKKMGKRHFGVQRPLLGGERYLTYK